VDDLISNQIDFGMNDIEIDYKLSMPGKIIETNAPFFKNDTLSWKVDNDRFRINDYNLKAISRKPNYWAFVITSLIVAAALLGFLIRRKPA